MLANEKERMAAMQFVQQWQQSSERPGMIKEAIVWFASERVVEREVACCH
jgi:hypothetical protein